MPVMKKLQPISEIYNFPLLMLFGKYKLPIIVLIIVSAVVIGSQVDITIESKPSWISIIPPLVAITLALLTRDTLVSLFIGIWVGVSLLNGNIIRGLTGFLDTYLVDAISNRGHASILLFTLGFGGIIGVISTNGGMRGIVNAVARFAKSRRRGQLATAIMGLLIFFDDYANSLLVGNMMRPFTDKLKISREKLSYLVDSTAAPIASLAVISTWSIFQMSLLEGPYQQYGVVESPYITFLRSIPYSYYCLFTIIFIFINIYSKREYGPMLSAERRACETGEVLRPGATPLTDVSQIDEAQASKTATHWSNAMIPILLVILLTFAGLYFTGLHALTDGMSKSIRNIIGGADSYAALLWASYITGFSAIILSLAKRILTLKEAIDAWMGGMKSMVTACAVLVLAWSLGKVCADIKTAEFLVSVSAGFITPQILPAITFITAAAISFSTGTSWATMSILIPIVMPMAVQLLGGEPNVVVASPVFTSTFASVLSGSVLGDHCSPLSDTTILSSTASSADHIDHVRTQLPYALTVGIIALVVGYLIIGFGGNWLITVILGIGIIAILFPLFGKLVKP